MAIDPNAGKRPDPSELLDVEKLIGAYYARKPDPSVAAQRVSFGTSGHRGSAFSTSFNEGHILATTEAICRYRQAQGTDGPLFLAMDTHALSVPAHLNALEVLAAHGLETRIAAQLGTNEGYTPTPVLSHAVLAYNRGRKTGLADGIVVTPSHNPPADGGFKYNPPNGGPADTTATKWIENEANRLLEGGPRRGQARPAREGVESADHAPARFPRRLRRGSRRGRGLRRDLRCQAQARRRSPRRRGRRLLAAHRGEIPFLARSPE